LSILEIFLSTCRTCRGFWCSYSSADER